MIPVKQLPSLTDVPNSILILFLMFLLLSCSSASRFSSNAKNKLEKRRTDQTRLNETAQNWLNTPYRYGGSSSSGIDCSALVQNIYRQVYNIKMPRSTSEQRRLGSSVDPRYLKPGDLLFFRNSGYGGIDHVGVYLGQAQFIHASTSRGVVIDSLETKFYREHFVVARRYRR